MLDVKGDKSLWEKRNLEGVGSVLLVEESYYDGIIEMLDKVAYVNEKGEPKITTKDLLVLLMDFELLQKENEKLKNAKVEQLEEYIGQLEHENQLLYGRLNQIRDLTNKEIK